MTMSNSWENGVVMHSFGKIGDINVNNKESYENKFFITFDVDWACDEVFSFAIDTMEDAGLPATWFITHETSLLARLRANEKFELGLHPNFNGLLSNSSGPVGQSANSIVKDILKIVPEAKAFRSHSMTQSSVLLNIFIDNGLTHDCNHFIPASLGYELLPWRMWNGLTRVPYFWEDDIHFLSECNFELSGGLVGRGIKVFDFHPIHVFLNTEHIDRYNRSREFHRDFKSLTSQRNEGPGTYNILSELLNLGKKIIF